MIGRSSGARGLMPKSSGGRMAMGIGVLGLGAAGLGYQYRRNRAATPRGWNNMSNNQQATYAQQNSTGPFWNVRG